MKTLEGRNSLARAAWVKERKTVGPKAISLSPEKLIKTSHLASGDTLPLVIQPNIGSLDLPAWARNNQDFIESNLLKYGGLLFRGFDTNSHVEFDQFLKSIPVDLMHYMEGATPRVELSDKIYSSTEFPPNQTIALHNELNYVTTWPMKIWFFCVQAAEQGGATPIGDVRKVFQRLSPKLRERFIEKGWMLVRNFGDGVGLPWQTSFRITDKAVLEAYCRKSEIECEWKGIDHLKTRQTRPAVAKHPKTGEMVWFNHTAFWHMSSLEPSLREVLMHEFGEDGLPYNTYYGDGSKIEDSEVEELREAYRQETIAFPWEAGDILMLDNMLTAHGRSPYSGERTILAAMGQPCSDRGI